MSFLNMIKKFKIFALLILTFTFLLFTFYFKIPVFAQSCGSTTPARATGLVSTPSLLGTFGTTGACIIDTKASFAPFKLPTYDDLKSIYYTKSKATKSTITSLTSIADQTVYLVNGDLTITSTPAGSGTAIVFVEGQLTINLNYTYGTPTSGTVFVVRGDVNILQSVTQVDAVIISEGTICTAHDGIICPVTNITTSQLVINGSLINFNSTAPIKFRRTLADNSTTPAELINHQPKYLVILKTIFSDTLQKWSEISGNEPIPTSPPTPTPAPADTDSDGDPDSTDCGINVFDAHNGQTAFFTTPYINNSGASSFDYDCNGTVSFDHPYRSDTSSCVQNTSPADDIFCGYTRASTVCDAFRWCFYDNSSCTGTQTLVLKCR